MDERQRISMKRTMAVLSTLQQFRGQTVYLTLIELLEEMKQDIRYFQDTVDNEKEFFRNQGGIHWLGEAVKKMKEDPESKRQPTNTDLDGAYVV